MMLSTVTGYAKNLSICVTIYATKTVSFSTLMVITRTESVLVALRLFFGSYPQG